MDDFKKAIVINGAAGATQATLVTATGYPLDLIKVIQQDTGGGQLANIKHVWKKSGIRGFYRGSAMPWISHMLKRPIQYPISEWMKAKAKSIRAGNTRFSMLDNYAIGFANGIVGPIFGTPLQVVKISMQTNTAASAGTSWQYIVSNWRRNGIRGFYRGFFPTMAKDCMFGSAFLGTYYTLRDITGSNVWYKNALNGSTAHCLTWMLLIPIDYVKTNVQSSEKKRRVIEVIRAGYREGGLRIFWRGVVPACLRTIPVSGCAMIGYETVRSTLTEKLS